MTGPRPSLVRHRDLPVRSIAAQRALLLPLAVLAAPLDADQRSDFATVEEACVARALDTPENCACGQRTAESLMSAAELAVLLAMMNGDGAAPARLGDGHDAFMEKLASVSEGCAVAERLR